jgi:SEC-C motif-containing protein
VHRATLAGADHGTVDFVARSKLGGRAHRLHEVSTFVREGGRWYYVAALETP